MTLDKQQLGALFHVILDEICKDGGAKIKLKKQEMLNKIEADLTYLKASLKTDLEYIIGVKSFKGNKYYYSTDDLTDTDVAIELGITNINLDTLQNQIIAESIGYNFELFGTQSFIQLIKNKYNGI